MGAHLMIDWLKREMSEPEIDLDGVSVPIVIRRHPRARRLTLRLSPDGSEVRVTVPPWAPQREAISFAYSREEWLAEQRAKLPSQKAPEDGGHIHYRGDKLRIEWRQDAPRKPDFAEDTVILGGSQNSLPRRLQQSLEARALELLEADRNDYCAKAGLDAAPVKLSRAQRRWGSCSDRKALRINWRLIQAPDAIRRSVVAHEVTHLVHFDHSPAFHAMLGDLFEGDITEADRWLKDNGRSLYAQFG
jgi:predicted metal-dependent hydrolase